MSNDKTSKKNIWKNFTIFGVLISIIFCVFFFNIKIGFTIFKNIEAMSSIITTNLIFVFIFVIITIIILLLVIYKIRKNRIEEKESDKLC